MKKIVFSFALALVFPAISWSESTQKIGAWTYEIYDDAFDGRIHVAVLPDENHLTKLVVGCKENVLSSAQFIFHVGSHLTSNYDREVNVRYKYDFGDADYGVASEYWKTTDDSLGVVLLGREALDRLKNLDFAIGVVDFLWLVERRRTGNEPTKNVYKFLIRVTERNGEKHDASFVVNGLKEVLDVVLPACGIELY